nr:MAG TPA: hypothetical protein [Caudoviricetes sp.]
MLNELICLILTLQRYNKSFNYANFFRFFSYLTVLNFLLKKLTIGRGLY